MLLWAISNSRTFLWYPDWKQLIDKSPTCLLHKHSPAATLQLVLSKPCKQLIKVMLQEAHFPISVQVERLINVQKRISNRLTKINMTYNDLNLVNQVCPPPLPQKIKGVIIYIYILPTQTTHYEQKLLPIFPIHLALRFFPQNGQCNDP